MNHAVITFGRWLLLAGLLLMVTGDGPSATIRLSRWPTPVPVLAWPWLYLLILTIAFGVLAAGGFARSWRPAYLRPMGRSLVLLLTACLLSTILSQFPSLSAMAFAGVLLIIGISWTLAVFIDDERIQQSIWPTIAVGVLFLAFRVIVWRRDEGLNVVAFQVQNNAWLGKLQLAWVFNLFAPLLLARAMSEPKRYLAALYGLTWAGSAVATYLLFSRMGSIVFGVTTLGVWLLNRSYWRKALVVALLVAALAAGGLIERSGRMSRFVVSSIFAPDTNPGVGIRLAAWRDSLRMFRRHPVAGTGLGTYDEAAYTLDGTSADQIYRGNGWHAHNVYLHVLAEMGLIGLLAWCYLWFAVLRRLLVAWRRTGDARGRLDLSAAVLAVLAFLALSTTEVLIGARVHASLRMNLIVGLVVVLALQAANKWGRESFEEDTAPAVSNHSTG